jgi:hypothetical protein
MSKNNNISEKAKRLPELIAYYEVCNKAEGKSPKTVSWYRFRGSGHINKL